MPSKSATASISPRFQAGQIKSVTHTVVFWSTYRVAHPLVSIAGQELSWVALDLQSSPTLRAATVATRQEGGTSLIKVNLTNVRIAVHLRHHMYLWKHYPLFFFCQKYMLTFYKYEHNNINKLFLKNANVIAKNKNVHNSLTFVRIDPAISSLPHWVPHLVADLGCVDIYFRSSPD